MLLDNKVRNHRAGYEVVTPLRLAEGIHVLVNRGWIEAPPRARRSCPRCVTPAGRVRVEGVLLARLPQPLKVGEGAKGRVRQSVDLKEFAAETGLTLQSFVIEQHSSTADGLLRDWPPPDAASRSTRPIRSSGTRSPRSPSCSASCFRSARNVTPPAQ